MLLITNWLQSPKSQNNCCVSP